MFKHVKYIDYMKVSISKIGHFSPHLCPKLIFNITYLNKTRAWHRAWPMPHFYTQVTWVWHIPKYEDNHAETFLPNIKCQTPHMLKCLYSPKQNVKYYLTSLHINKWTLAFTLTWSKTSSVHFLFLQGIKFQKMPIFHHIYAQNSYSTSHIWTKQELGIEPDQCPTFTPRSLGHGTFPNMRIIMLKLFHPT